jgi:hypothetical protein
MNEPHFCLKTDSVFEKPVLDSDGNCWFCQSPLLQPEPIEPEPMEVEEEELSELDKRAIRRLVFEGMMDDAL